MSPITRILVLLLAMGGGMIYKKISSMMGDVEAPQLPENQWWGDEEEPKDWEAYLANSSDVIGNRLMYPDTVSSIKSHIVASRHIYLFSLVCLLRLWKIYETN